MVPIQTVVLRLKQQADVKYVAQYLGLSKCLIKVTMDDVDDDDDDDVTRCRVFNGIER